MGNGTTDHMRRRMRHHRLLLTAGSKIPGACQAAHGARKSAGRDDAFVSQEARFAGGVTQERRCVTLRGNIHDSPSPPWLQFKPNKT